MLFEYLLVFIIILWDVINLYLNVYIVLMNYVCVYIKMKWLVLFIVFFLDVDECVIGVYKCE